ncbi:uncharacterized protein VTP21DRAFT_8872 [Calcarisporiella thermophila]|uniref:uncharacterized protein n=1 Tax=Calcarisporiella thermophila TaxID=911321 RepID=UPI00374401A7
MNGEKDIEASTTEENGATVSRRLRPRRGGTITQLTAHNENKNTGSLMDTDDIYCTVETQTDLDVKDKNIKVLKDRLINTGKLIKVCERTKEENAQLKAEIDALRNNIAILNAQKETLQKDLDKERANIEQFKTDFELTVSRADTMEQELTLQQASRNLAEEELEKVRKECTQSQNSLKSLQFKFMQLEEMLKENESDITIDKLKKENAGMAKEIQSKDEVIGTLSKELTDIKEKMNRSPDPYITRKIEGETHTELTTSHCSLELYQEEVLRLRGRISELEKENLDLRSYQKPSESAQAMEEAYVKLNSEVEHRKRLADKWEKEANRLRQDLETYKINDQRLYADLASEKERLNRELIQLRRELQQCREQTKFTVDNEREHIRLEKEYLSEIQRLKGEIEGLRKPAANIPKNHIVGIENISNTNTSTDHSQRQIKALLGELEDIRNENENLVQAKIALQELATEQQVCIQKLRSSLREAKSISRANAFQEPILNDHPRAPTNLSNTTPHACTSTDIAVMSPPAHAPIPNIPPVNSVRNASFKMLNNETDLEKYPVPDEDQCPDHLNAKLSNRATTRRQSLTSPTKKPVFTANIKPSFIEIQPKAIPSTISDIITEHTTNEKHKGSRGKRKIATSTDGSLTRRTRQKTSVEDNKIGKQENTVSGSSMVAKQKSSKIENRIGSLTSTPIDSYAFIRDNLFKLLTSPLETFETLEDIAEYTRTPKLNLLLRALEEIWMCMETGWQINDSDKDMRAHSYEPLIPRFSICGPEVEANIIAFFVGLLRTHQNSNFLERFYTWITEAIFLKITAAQIPVACRMCRAFVNLCRLTNDLQPARTFVYDLLRETVEGDATLAILQNVAQIWPPVLEMPQKSLELAQLNGSALMFQMLYAIVAGLCLYEFPDSDYSRPLQNTLESLCHWDDLNLAPFLDEAIESTVEILRSREFREMLRNHGSEASMNDYCFCMIKSIELGTFYTGDWDKIYDEVICKVLYRLIDEEESELSLAMMCIELLGSIGRNALMEEVSKIGVQEMRERIKKCLNPAVNPLLQNQAARAILLLSNGRVDPLVHDVVVWCREAERVPHEIEDALKIIESTR